MIYIIHIIMVGEKVLSFFAMSTFEYVSSCTIRIKSYVFTICINNLQKEKNTIVHQIVQFDESLRHELQDLL